MSAVICYNAPRELAACGVYMDGGAGYQGYQVCVRVHPQVVCFVGQDYCYAIYFVFQPPV